MTEGDILFVNVIVNYYSHSTEEGQAKVLEVTRV